MTVVSSGKSTGFDPARLIEEHQAGVWRYLRALGADPSLADDLTQDTFVAILRRPFEDYTPAATAAYLRKVAHNLFISAYRRSRRSVVVEDFESFEALWVQWQGNEETEARVEALHGCFEQLTERAQLALRLRFYERSSRAEIAAALEITEHGAKNLMQRAKHQLRDCIERKLT